MPKERQRRIAGVRINGRPVEPDEPWLQAVHTPISGEVLAELVGGGLVEAHAALEASRRVQGRWMGSSVAERAEVLRAIAVELRDSAVITELSESITRETGKRIAEARAEVSLSSQFFDWFASAISTRPNEIWQAVPKLHHTVTYHPLGVVVVVTPWNFPLSIPARKLAAALAAGCPILFKPSEVAPTAALRLTELLDDRLPSGVLNTVIGEPLAVMSSWLACDAARGMSFTGSTRVGAILASQAAPRFIRCIYELGGNAPFVVLDSADLDSAVDLLMIAKYRNNGQSCIAANQVWVPSRLHDAFVDRFVNATNTLVLGDPLREDTTLGPLALADDPERINRLVSDASDAGATVIESKVAVPASGYFGGPVICLDTPADARIRASEIFGPAVSINRYDALDEVISASRSSTYGLAGYVVGSSFEAASVAAALDVGLAGVNTATPNTPQIPFGGIKDSGYGWEGGQAGLDAFETYRSIAIASQ